MSTRAKLSHGRARAPLDHLIRIGPEGARLNLRTRGTRRRRAGARVAPEGGEPMTRRNGTLLSGAAALTLVAGLAAPRPAGASLDMQKKAKEAGFPAQNCQYCHVEKLPKKDAVSHNER